MESITKEVQEEGQPVPLFHIFSQTKEDCPSKETGTFSEFPNWPLDSEEVGGERGRGAAEVEQICVPLPVICTSLH